MGIILLACGKQAYDLFISPSASRDYPKGNLSDIADEVIAIPLRYDIKDAKCIRKEGNDLFLINDEILYRFNRNGELICRITNPEEIHVAGYVIDPANGN